MMGRVLRDPRVRLLLVLIVLGLALLVSWHLVAPGLHGMAMMLGLCFAVLAVSAVLLVPAGVEVIVGVPSPPGARRRLEHERVEPIGRHPPEGIPLRR